MNKHMQTLTRLTDFKSDIKLRDEKRVVFRQHTWKIKYHVE